MDVTVDGSEGYVVGMDHGTLSGRAVVVRVRGGKELGSGVFDYPNAVVTDALPADKDLNWNAAYNKTRRQALTVRPGKKRSHVTTVERSHETNCRTRSSTL